MNFNPIDCGGMGQDWMVKTRGARPVWKCEVKSEKVRSHTESEFRKGKVLLETKLVSVL